MRSGPKATASPSMMLKEPPWSGEFEACLRLLASEFG
jgi:hypothetical protein